MSWDAYVDQMEAGPGKCKYAAICGKEGGKWAVSKSENQDKLMVDGHVTSPVTDEEIMVATRALKDGDINIMGTGLKFGGNKYTCMIMENDSLICQGKERKDDSLVFCMSNQAVVLGFCPDSDISTRVLRGAMESVKDYLKQSNM